MSCGCSFLLLLKSSECRTFQTHSVAEGHLATLLLLGQNTPTMQLKDSFPLTAQGCRPPWWGSQEGRPGHAPSTPRKQRGMNACGQLTVTVTQSRIPPRGTVPPTVDRSLHLNECNRMIPRSIPECFHPDESRAHQVDN